MELVVRALPGLAKAIGNGAGTLWGFLAVAATDMELVTSLVWFRLFGGVNKEYE